MLADVATDKDDKDQVVQLLMLMLRIRIRLYWSPQLNKVINKGSLDYRKLVDYFILH